ncbi:MAG: prevent-host-death family protein [Acidobacteria bacterium]|nr:MAG: prevent-host-death family protein [Acidobacteriota bacterium]
MSLTQPQYVLDRRGKKRAVIVSIAQYRRLMEDLHDLAVVAERRRERAIGLGEMRRRLKSRGLL